MSEDDGGLLIFPKAADAIELRHLRAFVAVAEELNFGRAAAALYVSQPALSRQIRSLEQLMGCELLRRSTHRVELTLAGEALLDRARRLLRDVDEAVTSVQAVGGELAERAARLWAPIAEVWGPSGDLERARAAYEEMCTSVSPPEGVTVRSANAAGVPALVLTPPEVNGTSVLYLHGGGYVMGSAFGYQALGGAVASYSRSETVVVEYRLAPEHPYPAAVDDALTAYTWLISRTPAERVTVMGDSCGGHLAMALLLRLRDEGLPLPGGAALLCPFVDLTLEAPGPDIDPTHAMFIEHARHCLTVFLGGYAPDDPSHNAMYADLAGLPPLLIQAGTADPVVQDANRLHDRAQAAGVESSLELYPVETHVFHLFWDFLPEAMEGLRQAADFVREPAGTLDRTSIST
jgi:epsilon-lactone hydrolase